MPTVNPTQVPMDHMGTPTPKSMFLYTQALAISLSFVTGQKRHYSKHLTLPTSFSVALSLSVCRLVALSGVFITKKERKE